MPKVWKEIQSWQEWNVDGRSERLFRVDQRAHVRKLFTQLGAWIVRRICEALLLWRG